ncbi:pyrroloquinoline quinone biosynthesis peptide chaperone PqqD [Roseomonas sp. AR75]|jgi:pyrroloquinoline quinone biosynthesis protein D|uniref:pyrroloquinoline quinone biosynthesis peptide chaperone PqqD n=1 Tax=Roseomonas sp. AR75 TaxID=2562311 RepID=UPI0010C14BB0|nr:pyrroloquinoline quinone biosynthesis peptide chaperone PqqD [Roseomonas sp. AR75]
MSAIPADAIPRLARGVKLREDAARGRWVVLAPERMFVPDEIALEVLRLLDGARSLDAVVEELAARFAAPREEIAADVAELLADLAARGIVTT